MEQEQSSLPEVPPVAQAVLLVPSGSPTATLLVRVPAQEGRNEFRNATLGVTVVGEDQGLQEMFCHCCGVQVADVGGVADVAAFTCEDDLPDTRDCSAVKAHRTRLQRCEQGGSGRESPARCGIAERRNLSVCSRVGAARGLTPGNGDYMLPNHNTSTVGEVSGTSRFLSSIEADAHPTVVIARGHDGGLLGERAVVGVRHVE